MPKQTRKSFGVVFLAAVLGLAMLLPNGAAADPIEEFSQKEKLLAEKAGEVASLEDQLDLLEETADTKLSALAALRGRVSEIRRELDQVNSRLADLVTRETAARESLQKLINVDYQEGSPGAWEVLASSGSMAEALGEQNANGSMGDYANGLAKELQDVQEGIDEDRERLVSRKRNLEHLEAEAERQVRELEAVREVKANLLRTSQGEEEKFRESYEAAREQLVKLGLFARSARDRVGVRVWDGQGNYFNQLDARWIDATLGFSGSSTIGDYGCGVASAAMVFKHYGIDTNPLRLNNDLKRVRAFVGDLLDWRNVHLASGGRLALANSPYPVGRGNVDWGHIDRQLAGGNPVIVYVERPGQYSHYVTLLRKTSSGYVMHDPIEGPFLRFERHYSTGAVFQYITFRRT